MSYTGGIFNPYAYLEDIKPTQNASLTWVKGNHTYKMGGEMIFEGFPNLSYSRANGNLGFGAQQTADPVGTGQRHERFYRIQLCQLPAGHERFTEPRYRVE